MPPKRTGKDDGEDHKKQDRGKHEGKFLSENQYGFRTERSTIDTIMKVRTIIENKLDKGLEVVAVSLDIKNALTR